MLKLKSFFLLLKLAKITHTRNQADPSFSLSLSLVYSFHTIALFSFFFLSSSFYFTVFIRLRYSVSSSLSLSSLFGTKILSFLSKQVKRTRKTLFFLSLHTIALFCLFPPPSLSHSLFFLFFLFVTTC
jgi:hypothetical protein